MGVYWYKKVTSNKAKVTNVKALRKAIARFHSWLTIEVVAEGRSGAGTLSVHGDPGEATAVKVDKLAAIDTSKDKDRWAVYKLHEEVGESEFSELLLEMAPFLTSSLTVQSAEFATDGDFTAAREWTIQPAATAVEFKKIVAIDEWRPVEIDRAPCSAPPVSSPEQEARALRALTQARLKAARRAKRRQARLGN